MAEECPSINKLSKGCVHKNPLLTDKGKVNQKDIETFREFNKKHARCSIISIENFQANLDFSPTSYNCEDSENTSSEGDSESEVLEGCCKVWIPEKLNKKTNSLFKYNKDMSSKEILQMMRC